MEFLGHKVGKCLTFTLLTKKLINSKESFFPPSHSAVSYIGSQKGLHIAFGFHMSVTLLPISPTPSAILFVGGTRTFGLQNIPHSGLGCLLSRHVI